MMRLVRWAPLLLLLIFGGGCKNPEKTTKKAVEKVEDLGEKAKDLGEKGADEAKRLGRKAWKKTRRAAHEVDETARRVGTRAKEKAEDLAEARKCGDAYDHLHACLPKLLEGVSRSRALAKCAAALVSGPEALKKAILCVADSGGDCQKVARCKKAALKAGVLR